ncbi:agmatinase [Geoglobus acetivorans]|uniref:Agmatinase n=1 Tax=Geoglobus acetivorans TaxID=565033 RepID=A0A0A7GFV7_GEOAI|nr:Agmatinase [Geoglobus acetivorans]
MHIDSFFATSNSSVSDADYIIFGIPYDATQSFKPGSRFAPTAIREASWNLESYSLYFDYNLDFARIADGGNINCDGSFEEVSERVSKFMEDVVGIPVVLGGEHSVSYMVARNLEDFTYLVFDAHFDLREGFDSNPYNHACTSRRILEVADEVIIAGVRSGTKEEREFAENSGIEVYYSWDLLEYGFDDLLDSIESKDRIYLSVDLDAFDPAFAPGVSTPEPFGLHPYDLVKVLDEIADRVIAFDVVEVVPDLNKVTQTLAAKFVNEFIAANASLNF